MEAPDEHDQQRRPTTAVTMPIGPAGAKTIRATTSGQTRNAAPIKAATG